jgi:hypothetical protein
MVRDRTTADIWWACLGMIESVCLQDWRHMGGLVWKVVMLHDSTRPRKLIRSRHMLHLISVGL